MTSARTVPIHCCGCGAVGAGVGPFRVHDYIPCPVGWHRVTRRCGPRAIAQVLCPDCWREHWRAKP